jgi:hypothetical protein
VVPGSLTSTARILAVTLALLLALPAVQAAPDSEGAPARDGPAGPDPPTDEAGLLLHAVALDGDARSVALAQAFQGRSGPGLYRYAYPPATTYNGVDPTCDLDGDGAADLIDHEMTLRQNGRFDSGFSHIAARSGANGTTLWGADNLLYYNLGLAGSYASYRAGQTNPNKPANVQALPDVDGDGVCDVFAYGFDTEDILTPVLIGSPSLTAYEVTVRVLSGRNGTAIWSTAVESLNADHSMPLFGWWTGNAILGFPTGFALVDTPGGLRFALKTTDFLYDYAWDPFRVTKPVTGADPTYASSLETAEHVILGNASDGSILWQRDFGADFSCATRVTPSPGAAEPGCAERSVPDPAGLSPGRTDRVNITWLSGAGDLDGDGEPDLVLDTLTLTNPHTSETHEPLTGKPMFQYGRGMRVFALQGKDGSDLWATTLLDPLAVQPPPLDEENQEILAWTLGTVLPDADGDGKAEPYAQYMTEEMVGGTLNGRHKTHFIRLAADGTPLWDHPQQGWGHLAPLSADRVAVGTIDLPDGLREAKGRFPEKALRIAGLDAATGAPAWAYEEPYAQDSQSSYEIGLQHLAHALAPLDVDGDGRLDVVTPSRYVQPKGHDQVFVATSRQTFQVLGGGDGHVLSTLGMWGPNGLLLPCADGDVLTFAVGHARRMDLVRVDAATGRQVARRAVFSMVEERSGLVGMDLLSLDGACRVDGGRLTYGLNLEAYSFYRRYEIIPVLGVVQADGDPVWREPEMVDEEPPTPSLLEAYSSPPPLLPPGAPFAIAVAVAVAAGLGLGGLLGLPAGKWLAARRRRLDPLGLALILMVVPPLAVQDAGHAADPVGAAAGPSHADALAADAAVGPAPAGLPAAGAADGPADAAAAIARQPTPAEAVRAWLVSQDPDVSDVYDENETLAYPHVLGDMDGDGVDDLALDVYCTGSASCSQFYHDLYTETVEFARDLARAFPCGPAHQLVVVSGARGDRLWDAPLDTPVPLAQGGTTGSCGAETVVGLVPLPGDGMGILLYRFEVVDPAFNFAGRLYNHTLYLRDGQSGAVLWSYSQAGYSTSRFLVNEFADTAENLLLNPILVHPDAGQVPSRMGGAQLALFVQGIGHRISNANTLIDVTGMLDRPVRATDEYLPVEWLARLDPATGAVQWRTDSFLPEPGHSVLPTAAEASPFRGYDEYGYREHTTWDYPLDIPRNVPERAWASGLCCGDLNGDGVFDPVFTTLEWNSQPDANAAGPHVFDSRVLAFDGASGGPLWSQRVVHDHPLQQQRTPYWQYPDDSFTLAVQGVGDADGDGAADILLHERTNFADFRYDTLLLDGRTGAVHWDLPLPRAQAALVLGDADRDGGNDLLFVDWYAFEQYRDIQGDYTNATQNVLRARSGASGAVLYEASTYAAAADVVRQFQLLGNGGVPDLDRDGVGDFPVDDPVYLPDQVVLHQLRFLSGRDGHRLFGVPVAGALAFAATLPDLDGDGSPELAVLGGDANDLWLDYRDGRTGRALWGHRAFTVRASDYVLTVPNMAFTPMRTGFGEHDVGFVANLHMLTEEVVGEYESYYITVGGPSGSVRELAIDSTTVPQLLVVLDGHGARSLAYPSAGGIDATRVDGELPGTAAILALQRVAEPSPADIATRAVADGWVPLVAFGGCFLAAFAAVAALVRARGKGVPA